MEEKPNDTAQEQTTVQQDQAQELCARCSVVTA